MGQYLPMDKLALAKPILWRGTHLDIVPGACPQGKIELLPSDSR